MTGWWYTYPSEKWWSSSVGMMKFSTEWKVIKFMFQTTNQIISHYNTSHHICYPLVNWHRPWQIGLGRLVSIKNWLFSGSNCLFTRYVTLRWNQYYMTLRPSGLQSHKTLDLYTALLSALLLFFLGGIDPKKWSWYWSHMVTWDDINDYWTLMHGILLWFKNKWIYSYSASEVFRTSYTYSSGPCYPPPPKIVKQ